MIASNIITFTLILDQLKFPNSSTPFFTSCEELRNHGVEIDGHYIINGTETYCKDMWSKYYNFFDEATTNLRYY